MLITTDDSMNNWQRMRERGKYCRSRNIDEKQVTNTREWFGESRQPYTACTDKGTKQTDTEHKGQENMGKQTNPPNPNSTPPSSLLVTLQAYQDDSNENLTLGLGVN